MWLHKLKRRPDGTPHFKSRLVAKGCSQIPGVDYQETYAPTPRLTSARMMLHLAATHDLSVHIMDVDQAFLHGELEEEVYMEPPPGMPGHPGPDMVWRLRRPLYGLKQAPRQWHAKIKGVLLSLGFKPTHGDASMFLKQEGGIWILVYVDDLMLVSNSEKDLGTLKASLLQHFPMKDLGKQPTT